MGWFKDNAPDLKKLFCMKETWKSITYGAAFLALLIVALVQITDVTIRFAAKPVVVHVKVNFRLSTYIFIFELFLM